MRIAIIGAGAAGMTAAGFCRTAGADVTVFEKNEKPGRKLAITGKGRCNLTNNCTFQEFLENVPTNPRFLMSCLSSFAPSDAMALLESLGVPLKTERGNRVFPVSDRAFDIVDALRKFMGVRITNETVKHIEKSEETLSVITDTGKHTFDRVILATGGKSYPTTGSTGDGYRMAEETGHTITPLIPSLVPLASPDAFCARMMGLSLRNVALTLYDSKGRLVTRDFGEMLFTHFGITGPMILSASSHIKGNPDGYHISLDLKPALSPEKLDERILSDFSSEKNREFRNSLGALLPSKMIPVVVERSGIEPRKKVNSVTKEERRRLGELLKSFDIRISGYRPIDEAVITSGGVSVREINPKTMESKIIGGLYFAGEIIDVDAYTGGFNLQIAFSTAHAAAVAAASQ